MKSYKLFLAEQTSKSLEFKLGFGRKNNIEMDEASLKFKLDDEPGMQAGASFYMVNPDSPLAKHKRYNEKYGLLHQVSLSGPEWNKADKSWHGVLFATLWTGRKNLDDIIYSGYHKNYKEMISKTEKALKKYTKGKWNLRKAPTEEELLKGDLKNRHNNSAN